MRIADEVEDLTLTMKDSNVNADEVEDLTLAMKDSNVKSCTQSIVESNDRQNVCYPRSNYDFTSQTKLKIDTIPVSDFDNASFENILDVPDNSKYDTNIYEGYVQDIIKELSAVNIGSNLL